MPGVVFTNVLLADEINRTPPRTQAALLEAMQERTVTVEGKHASAARPVPRHRDPEPVRARGHLPAARVAARPLPLQDHPRLRGRGERDRHAPAPAHRRHARHAGRDPARCSASSASTERAARPRRTEVPERGRTVHRRDRARTRAQNPGVELGASSRAAIHLLSAAKAHARLDGRDYVTIEDVRDGGAVRAPPPPHLPRRARRRKTRSGRRSTPDDVRAGPRAAPRPRSLSQASASIERALS